MTSPKKPRESRKPLDQSFLEFVHKNDPEPDPSAISKSESSASFVQLEQELVELQRRFVQLEQTSRGQDSDHLSQMEQLTQLTQEVEQMRKNTNQSVELQQQLDDLKTTLLDRDSRHFSQVEHQLTYLAHHVEQLGADVRKLCTDLQHYFTQPEVAAADQLANQPADQVEPLTQLPPAQPEASSIQPSMPKHTDQTPQRQTESDSLLSWISPLLDNF